MTKKMTYAEGAEILKKKLDGYNKILANQGSTSLQRDTAKRNIENIYKHLATLASAQEASKGPNAMAPDQQYRIGGRIGRLDSGGTVGMRKPQLPTPTPVIVPRESEIPVEVTPSDEVYRLDYKEDFTPGRYTPNWGSFAAPLMNVASGTFGKAQHLNYDPMGYVKPITMDISNQLREANESDAVNRKNISSLSPQQVISGNIGSSDWKQKAISRLEMEKQMFDAQDRARAEGVNVGIDQYNRQNQWQYNMENMASEAARQNMINAGVAGISQAAQTEQANRMLFNQMENERKGAYNNRQMQVGMFNAGLQEDNRQAQWDRYTREKERIESLKAFKDAMAANNAQGTGGGTGGDTGGDTGGTQPYDVGDVMAGPLKNGYPANSSYQSPGYNLADWNEWNSKKAASQSSLDNNYNWPLIGGAVALGGYGIYKGGKYGAYQVPWGSNVSIFGKRGSSGQSVATPSTKTTASAPVRTLPFTPEEIAYEKANTSRIGSKSPIPGNAVKTNPTIRGGRTTAGNGFGALGIAGVALDLVNIFTGNDKKKARAAYRSKYPQASGMTDREIDQEVEKLIKTTSRNRPYFAPQGA